MLFPRLRSEKVAPAEQQLQILLVSPLTLRSRQDCRHVLGFGSYEIEARLILKPENTGPDLVLHVSWRYDIFPLDKMSRIKGESSRQGGLKPET